MSPALFLRNDGYCDLLQDVSWPAKLTKLKINLDEF